VKDQVTDKDLPSWPLMRFQVSCFAPVRQAFEFFAAPVQDESDYFRKCKQYYQSSVAKQTLPSLP
jgi:hypothetical protein